jgi:hypothetical protein
MVFSHESPGEHEISTIELKRIRANKRRIVLIANGFKQSVLKMGEQDVAPEESRIIIVALFLSN